MLHANLGNFTFDELIVLRNVAEGWEDGPETARKIIRELKDIYGDAYTPSRVVVTSQTGKGQYAFTENGGEIIDMFADELHMVMVALDMTKPVVIHYTNGVFVERGFMVVNGQEETRHSTNMLNAACAAMEANDEIITCLDMFNAVDEHYHHDTDNGVLYIFRFDGHVTRISSHFAMHKFWAATQFTNPMMVVCGKPEKDGHGSYPTLADAITANR